MSSLSGQVAAILCSGDAGDRAITMALAEAGADIALGTLDRAQEFAVASIANEVWAVGREQFSTALDATDAISLAAFAAETADRLGRCDLLAVCSNHPVEPASPPEEISAEEWSAALDAGLTIPFLAAHAFQPVIERDGGGVVVFIGEHDASGLVASVARAGRAELTARLNETWTPRGVRLVMLSASSSPEEIVALATKG